jgi:tetratricopeptide (TPR) repeat protein
VITVVPSRGQFVWLDTTPEVAPYGLLLTVLRDKQALVIPSNAAPTLMRTPQNPPFPEDQEFSAKGKLGADGTFTAHVEQVYRGDVEVALRTAFRQMAQSQWKEATQGFSYRLGFAGDVSNVKVSPPEDTDKPFELSYDYVRKNYGDWEHHQITPPMPPLGIEVTKDSREKKPSEPVLLGAIGKIVYRTRVELPAGYSMIAPSPVNLVKPYAEYHSTSVVEDGVLTSSRQFLIKKDEVALDDWDDFRKFGKAVADDEYNFIPLSSSALAMGKAGSDEDNDDSEDIDDMFRDGTQALQRRDGRQAQRLFEKVIARDPTYRGAHLNLGLAFVAQGNFSDGLAAFRKEEEITPDETRSYLVASAYANFTGQKDDAIEELRKLLKVDPDNRDGATNLGQLLGQAGKYAEAAEVLENAVKTSPDNSNLQFALGSAYLKMGQPEKAVTHMRAAVEAKEGDSMVLNNVAYTLAESKTNLDLARQYGEQALGLLEKRASDDVVALDTGTRLTYQLSLLWDTLGWVYFQSGDIARSERFVRAAWVLGQDSVVGEHLGEIYEKEGKGKAAAQVYELALAAQPVPRARITRTAMPGVPDAPSIDNSAYTAQREKILSRYVKLTGHKPTGEIHRLPNGEWTKMPSEQLTQMRTAKLGKLPLLSGTAEFAIVFAPGKTESVEYVDGKESMKQLAEKLKAAHYAVEFPAGSTAKILRRAELSCTASAGCIAVLLPPANATFSSAPQ